MSAEVAVNVAEDSSGGVRRSYRDPRRFFLEKPDIKQLLKKIIENHIDTVVLKIKDHVSSDAVNDLVLAEIIAALQKNTVCQALYVQNLTLAMTNEMLSALINMLKKRPIWCLNIGENYKVSTAGWVAFCKALPDTSVTHLYVSEHVISSDLKNKMRDYIRGNRKKHNMHSSAVNLQVIERCTHMWWNPINAFRHKSASEKNTHTNDMENNSNNDDNSALKELPHQNTRPLNTLHNTRLQDAHTEKHHHPQQQQQQKSVPPSVSSSSTSSSKYEGGSSHSHTSGNSNTSSAVPPHPKQRRQRLATSIGKKPTHVQVNAKGKPEAAAAAAASAKTDQSASFFSSSSETAVVVADDDDEFGAKVNKKRMAEETENEEKKEKEKEKEGEKNEYNEKSNKQAEPSPCDDDGFWRFECVCGEKCSSLDDSQYHPVGRMYECTHCALWSHVDCVLGKEVTDEQLEALSEVLCSKCRSMTPSHANDHSNGRCSSSSSSNDAGAGGSSSSSYTTTSSSSSSSSSSSAVARPLAAADRRRDAVRTTTNARPVARKKQRRRSQHSMSTSAIPSSSSSSSSSSLTALSASATVAVASQLVPSSVAEKRNINIGPTSSASSKRKKRRKEQQQKQQQQHQITLTEERQTQETNTAQQQLPVLLQPTQSQQQQHQHAEQLQHQLPVQQQYDYGDNWVFHCICGAHCTASDPVETWPTGKTFECTNCSLWVHVQCCVFGSSGSYAAASAAADGGAFAGGGGGGATGGGSNDVMTDDELENREVLLCHNCTREKQQREEKKEDK